jgi:carboxymethylenebutenolidase
LWGHKAALCPALPDALVALLVRSQGHPETFRDLPSGHQWVQGHQEPSSWLTRLRTGGVGFESLRHFYAHHFIGVNPPDFELLPVSRTVGKSSLVDEFIVRFTHTTRMDWMLPGIEPTGRAVGIPTVAIVQFQEDKLVHEHIYWDQASVLVQLGLLDPGGLPIAGAETARKVLDVSLPSNTLMTPSQ